MALRKEAGNTATAAAPAFEAEETGAPEAVETAVETVVETAAEVHTASEVAAASVAATTAVAKAAGGALAPVGQKYQAAFQEYQNVIDPASLDFDTFPRITVGLDGFSDQDENELGKKIRLRIMSYNERYILTTGEDNPEANELVRYSLDGKTIDSTGEDCAAYIKKLREVEGYDDAAIKKYLNIYGFLEATSDGNGNLTDLPEDEQTIVSIQVPPRSLSKFSGFQISQGVKLAQGKVEATDVLFLTQNKVKGSKRTYAEIVFSTK